MVKFKGNPLVENSNFINGNTSNVGVGAVYLDVILHFGC